MGKAVLFEVDAGVALITLNRPERYNAVNQDLVDGISESLTKAKDDKSTLIRRTNRNKLRNI